MLSSFNIMPEPDDFAVLCKKFHETAANGQATGRQDVNYKAMVRALEGGNAESATSFRKSVKVMSSLSKDDVIRKRGTVMDAVDVQELLADLREVIAAKRVRVKDFMAEGDKLRKGKLTRAKFMTAVNRANLTLTESELDALMRRFVADGTPDLMDWRAFVQCVEGTERLEADPTSSITTTMRTRFSEADAPVNQEWLEDVLRQIKSATFQKRLYMKPYFKDYDKHNNCRVTKTQFLAVLDLMGININANEKELLVRAFQHKEGRLVTSDVDYKRFVRRVDQVEQK